MNFDTTDQSRQLVLFRTAIIGGVSLLLMLMMSFKSVIPNIEKELMNQVSVQLLKNKHDNILVSVTGQDVFLEGLINSADRDNALEVAANVHGVRKVHDNFIITDSREN
jgi:hypothetical protein